VPLVVASLVLLIWQLYSRRDEELDSLLTGNESSPVPTPAGAGASTV
jgi:hypothetical protein